MSHQIEELDRRLDVSTKGALDVPTLGFLGAMGLAFIQILRGDVLAPATTLISDALRILPVMEGRRIVVHGTPRKGDGQRS